MVYVYVFNVYYVSFQKFLAFLTVFFTSTTKKSPMQVKILKPLFCAVKATKNFPGNFFWQKTPKNSVLWASLNYVDKVVYGLPLNEGARHTGRKCSWLFRGHFFMWDFGCMTHSMETQLVCNTQSFPQKVPFSENIKAL